MNKDLFKKMLPHLIAAVIFLVVAVIYCKPVLEGKVLQQHDITHWKGAIHQSQVYAETHDGKYPLWTNALFSGMPAFQIGFSNNNFIPGIVHKILTLGLPVPIQFFFLASICFYFLCIVLGVNSFVGIMGSLAFAYATYNPVIISVGHDTKMWSIAYMPAMLGSILLIYKKKYWLGAALTGVFTATLIAMNHLQITYYLFLVVGIVTAFHIVRWITKKEWKHLFIACAIALVSIAVGVLTNAINLFSTYEYQKETIRGGGSILTDTSQNVKSKTGLDKDYAFSYSLGIAEPFVMMVPRMFGGSTGYPTIVGGEGYKEMNEDDSKTIQALQSLPQQVAQEVAQFTNLYWGGMTKPGEVGTSGPPYIGAIICFLAILAIFILDNKYKWWLLTAIGLAILMSWGSYFDGFNAVLYKYLPFYNKFRAPSMILVIPQLLLPVLAVLCLDRIIKEKDKKLLLPFLKKGMIATVVVFVVLFLVYMSFEFLSNPDKSILKQVRGMNNAQLLQSVDSFFDGLKADRKSLMLTDIFRAFGFIAAAALLLFMFLKKAIKPPPLITGLALLSFIDVMTIDVKYLNADNYVEQVENEGAFQQTNADKEILADKSYYRVYNVSQNAFQENFTSYYYNSIGGYHPAKLRIYNDLIEMQIAKAQPNMSVFNMLNAKYFIQKNGSGATEKYQKNDSALGPAWLIKSIRFVKDANEEMAGLEKFNPKDTAIIQESYKASIPFLPQTDSTALIQLIKNDNDIITYSFASASNQFAVFSEIFYNAGWKAFIDGKETPIVKVNYVLRGLPVPPGKHNIEFRFRPQGYYLGRKMTSIFSIILLGLLAFGIFMEWRNNKIPQ